MIQSEDQMLPIAGGRIFVRVWTHECAASSAPIILFHDSLGCVDLWRRFPEKLAEATARRVIAFDRLGFGRSDTFPGQVLDDFMAREASETLPVLQREVAFTRFIACGHSVGGGMGVEAAAQHPSEALAVVTMGAQAFVEEQTLKGIREARARFASPDGLSRLARYHGDKARWVVDAWTETWLDPARRSWTLDHALARLRCPVLAIHGEVDEYGSAEQPRRIASVTGGRLELQSGIGHVPHRDAEGDVISLIAGFLAGLTD